MVPPVSRWQPAGVADVRPFTPDDIAGAADVWDRAFEELRGRFHLPHPERDAESDARFELRVRHFLRTDPDGAWVSHDGQRVTGVAVAIRRRRLWVLSMLAVGPTAQDRGVGRALLERALAYGDADSPGIILASRDPKAIRRYTLAGFALRPAITAWGPVQRAGLAAVTGVRDGSVDDLELAADVDRLQRGASHGPDFDLLLADAGRLLVYDHGTRRGYAVVREPDHRPVLLAATDPEVAAMLLTAALADAPPDAEIEVGWLTAAQQWAVRTCLAAGMELHPVGPVMVRGHPGPMSPYIPNGASG
jgi:GNAT superfamily N-acetyltransferase